MPQRWNLVESSTSGVVGQSKTDWRSWEVIGVFLLGTSVFLEEDRERIIVVPWSPNDQYSCLGVGRTLYKDIKSRGCGAPGLTREVGRD